MKHERLNLIKASNLKLKTAWWKFCEKNDLIKVNINTNTKCPGKVPVKLTAGECLYFCKKSSVVDVWLGSKHASANYTDLYHTHNSSCMCQNSLISLICREIEEGSSTLGNMNKIFS